MSSIVEILQTIDRPEEILTKVQGVKPSPHLITKLLYNVFWLWSLYLNRCVAVSALEVLDAFRANTPFLLDTILMELEGGGQLRGTDPSRAPGGFSCSIEAGW